MTVASDLSNTDYHALPSLSASGAKILLQEGGPAKYRAYRDSPPVQKPEFDWGTSLHTELLGTGDEFADVGFKAWNAKGCKEAKEKLVADGKIPLRTQDYQAVKAAAQSARSNPTIAKLLSEGEPELSLFCTDPDTGVELRCRPDWYRPGLCLDVKTAIDASPTGFGKVILNLSYDLAAAMYLDVIGHVTGDTQCGYAWIVVEKTPPYLTAVYEPTEYALAKGFEKYREAVRIFAACNSTGTWAGYPPGITHPNMPAWA